MSNQSIKRYITSDLWETFQFAELIEVMRQDLCGWCWWRCWYRFKRAIRKSKPSIISNKCLFIFLRKQTINNEMGLFERLLWSLSLGVILIGPITLIKFLQIIFVVFFMAIMKFLSHLLGTCIRLHQLLF